MNVQLIIKPHENNNLSYVTIVRMTSGEPEILDEVLRHYSKRI